MNSVAVTPRAAREASSLAANTSTINRALSGSYATKASLLALAKAAREAGRTARNLRAEAIRLRRTMKADAA